MALYRELGQVTACHRSVFAEQCGANASEVMARLLGLVFRDPSFLRLGYRPDCMYHAPETTATTTTTTTTTTSPTTTFDYTTTVGVVVPVVYPSVVYFEDESSLSNGERVTFVADAVTLQSAEETLQLQLSNGHGQTSTSSTSCFVAAAILPMILSRLLTDLAT